MHPALSPNVRKVVGWFDLDLSNAAPPPPSPPAAALVEPGEIVLFTGPSGAGKSLALQRLVEHVRPGATIVDLDAIPLPERPCVDQFGRDAKLACSFLSRVGLAEAWTCLRTPGELSDGQRWRLRLARALFHLTRRAGRCRRQGLEPRPALLVSDEFCAVLDRVSAAVVARCVRRTIDRLHRVNVPVSAAVATSHDDLADALLPDRLIRCDFECGGRISSRPAL